MAIKALYGLLHVSIINNNNNNNIVATCFVATCFNIATTSS
jgi:hypothetical protein